MREIIFVVDIKVGIVFFRAFVNCTQHIVGNLFVNFAILSDNNSTGIIPLRVRDRLLDETVV